ncbi:hypothetical protein EMIT036CA2_50147 [Chryseobacterium sp. IT-36CA2]
MIKRLIKKIRNMNLITLDLFFKFGSIYTFAPLITTKKIK